MRVLIACEYSGSVRDAFIAMGHEAVSCDLLPTEIPVNFFRGCVRNKRFRRLSKWKQKQQQREVKWNI